MSSHLTAGDADSIPMCKRTAAVRNLYMTRFQMLIVRAQPLKRSYKITGGLEIQQQSDTPYDISRQQQIRSHVSKAFTFNINIWYQFPFSPGHGNMPSRNSSNSSSLFPTFLFKVPLRSTGFRTC
jgi:hypothetical protein